MITRRTTLKGLAALPLAAYMQSLVGCGSESPKDFPQETHATIHRANGDNPDTITRRVIDSLGGISAFVNQSDVVVLKVNSQRWNQGMTNTDVLCSLIQQILDIPGFDGEIIVADNHQDTEPNSRGWTTDERNGKFNLNELITYFNDRGYPNVTKYHWHPAGPNPHPLQYGGSGNSRVNHPEEGDGYVWPENLYYDCPHGNRCLLAYPIFTSAYSGMTVDLKNGLYSRGRYLDGGLKFFNVATLNHHGVYVGVTGAVKNYMGVVDMSCGYPGTEPEGTFNTHHVGASGLFRFLAANRDSLYNMPGRLFYRIYLHPSVFRFRYTGGVLGKYMKLIRSADLHILAAVTVGWGHRTDLTRASPARTILAGTDPIALDYAGARDVLLPATKQTSESDRLIELNDPTREDGPFRNFLQDCRRELGGTINDELIRIVTV